MRAALPFSICSFWLSFCFGSRIPMSSLVSFACLHRCFHLFCILSFGFCR